MKQERKNAKIYAYALRAVCEENLALLETLLTEIKIINDIFDSVKETRQIFVSPAFSKEEKKELIKKLFSSKINQTTLNFLLLVIDNKRFNLLSDIQNELIKIVNNEKGIVTAELFSAYELDNSVLNELKLKLENMYQGNKKVTIEHKIEPDLIGGLKVKIDDLLFDGSIKGRLAELKRRIEA